MTKIRVDEDNNKAKYLGKISKVRQFLRDYFLKNIGCIISAPIFGVGGAKLWERG